jgi:hypothetical protein
MPKSLDPGMDFFSIAEVVGLRRGLNSTLRKEAPDPTTDTGGQSVFEATAGKDRLKQMPSMTKIFYNSGTRRKTG